MQHNIFFFAKSDVELLLKSTGVLNDNNRSCNLVNTFRCFAVIIAEAQINTFDLNMQQKDKTS